MYLSDNELLTEVILPGCITCAEGPQYVAEFLLNPASIDIRVGPGPWLVETFDGTMEHREISPGAGRWLEPGEFVLVPMLESVRVPDHLVADLRLKSTMARGGTNHLLAMWTDPGWNGVLTMEFHNVKRYGRTLLMPGQKIAQIVFSRLTSPPKNPYRGRYQNATGVEGSKS